MRGIYDGYTLIRTGGKTTFFAGGNTESGFVGCYEDIANEKDLKRVYIIKGGPGTGKSTLMRSIASRAEEAGHSAEYYRCGSDPDSLDCILLGGSVAILDGTAPHAWEMKYPGVRSELIDVSKYLDKDKLESHKDEIIFASAMKTSEYASAYRYMRATSAAETEMLENSVRLFDSAKAEKYIKRLIRNLGKANIGGGVKYRYTHAITMRGMWKLDTLACCGETRYTVDDSLSVAPHFMTLLKEELRKAGYTLTVGLVSLGGHISGIYIHDADVSVTVGEREEGCKNINMNRFVIHENEGEFKGKVRLGAKVREACLKEAMSSLDRTANHHFILEEIYKSAMDFDSRSHEIKLITEDIMLRLQKQDKKAEK